MGYISPLAGLLRYVNPQGEGALARLWSMANGGKNQISNLAFIYTCIEILLFLY